MGDLSQIKVIGNGIKYLETSCVLLADMDAPHESLMDQCIAIFVTSMISYHYFPFVLWTLK